MKINRPLEIALPNFQIVKDKTGRDSMSEDRGQQQKHPKEDDQNPATFEVTEQKLEAAIDAFSAENKAQLAGLNASMAGQGPGLKVILRDGTGAIVRQFTGEEFLKLRETTAKDVSGRGKILDQKL